MITEKTHEFITAYFTNDDKTFATAEWKEKSTGKITMEAIVCKKGEYEWDRLMSILTEDELHEKTYHKYQSGREAYEIEIMRIAKREGLIDEIIEDQDSFFLKFAEYFILDKNECSNEKLFRFKLKLFEHDMVAKSTDREKKATLRKAQTFRDALNAYAAFRE